VSPSILIRTASDIDNNSSRKVPGSRKVTKVVHVVSLSILILTVTDIDNPSSHKVHKPVVSHDMSL
jgi:hypothetical protein